MGKHMCHKPETHECKWLFAGEFCYKTIRCECCGTRTRLYLSCNRGAFEYCSHYNASFQWNPFYWLAAPDTYEAWKPTRDNV